MDTPEQPKKKISELVGQEIQRQENEREQEEAFADIPEKFDPSNPGGTFARRVIQRLGQQRFAEQ